MTYGQHARHALGLVLRCLGCAAQLAAHAVAPDLVPGLDFTIDRRKTRS